MNCLEFRRQLLADPLCTDGELLAHEEHCLSCAPFARELRAQEIQLRSLLQDVAPPPGMAERIRLAARFEERATVQRRWWLSAAAMVLVAIGVSMLSLFNTSVERADQALAQSVLNHIEDEAPHLREVQPVSAGRLDDVFDRFGARIAGDLGTVTFAAECLMRNRTGVHLVMPGSMGPITVFFMPGEMADGTQPIISERFSGQIIPTDWGSIAIVGENGEPLDGLGERLVTAVSWPRQALAASDLAGRGALTGGIRLVQQQDS